MPQRYTIKPSQNNHTFALFLEQKAIHSIKYFLYPIEKQTETQQNNILSFHVKLAQI